MSGRISRVAARASPPRESPRINPTNANPMNTISGVSRGADLKGRPRTARFRYAVTASPHTTVISSGLSETPSARYMIDSQLDRFLANGNHQTVTKSPVSVRAMVAPSAALGNQTQAANRSAKHAHAIPK